MKIHKFPLPKEITFIASVTCAIIILWAVFVHFYLKASIEVDGQKIPVRARAKTIAELLTAQNIQLGKMDIVAPPLDSPVPSRGVVQVIRVSERVEKEDEYSPFKVRWKKRMSDNLRAVELQKGVQRRKMKDIRIVFHDNREVTRQVVRERDISKTVYRLVLIGKDNNIEQVFDLSRAKKMKMVATAYYPGDPLCWGDGTVTCMGMKMQRGIVAVDPRVIPLGTRVFVSGYGYGFAGDTGNAIKGHRIDLGVNNADEEKPWMHRPVTVYILDKAKKW